MQNQRGPYLLLPALFLLRMIGDFLSAQNQQFWIWRDEAGVHTSSVSPRDVFEKPPVQEQLGYPKDVVLPVPGPVGQSKVHTVSRQCQCSSRMCRRGKGSLTCSDIERTLAESGTWGWSSPWGAMHMGFSMSGHQVGHDLRQAAETALYATPRTPDLSKVGAWRDSKLQEQLTRVRLSTAFIHQVQLIYVRP